MTKGKASGQFYDFDTKQLLRIRVSCLTASLFYFPHKHLRMYVGSVDFTDAAQLPLSISFVGIHIMYIFVVLSCMLIPRSHLYSNHIHKQIPWTSFSSSLCSSSPSESIQILMNAPKRCLYLACVPGEKTSNNSLPKKRLLCKINHNNQDVKKNTR